MVLSEYKRILVGIDGSKQARRAADKAIASATRNHASLTIVTVMGGGKFVGLGRTSAGFGYVDQQVMDEAKADLTRLVDAVAQKATQAGVTEVTAKVIFGNAKVEMSKTLPQELGTDLIIVGATGANVVERMLMGSTASYIVANAVCDVLVVRTDLDNRPLTPLPIGWTGESHG